MAQKSKTNGQGKKLFNNFLDTIEIGNGVVQINGRNGRGQKRNQQLYNSIKYDNEVSKSTNVNPLKFIEESRGRNMVNRSLCYESHNNSIINNTNSHGPNNFLNSSFDHPNNITVNSALGFMIAQAGNAQERKKIQQQQQQQQQQILTSNKQATSQLPNQRNMILNLSQMNNINLQAQQKAAYVQQIVNNPQQAHQPFNSIYTLDYIKSTKASHNSKNSSISKNNKEVTKRSGTTGGTGSNNNSHLSTELQKQQILLMKGFNNHLNSNSKSGLPSKSTGKKKGRQIVQQSLNGINMKNIDKLRASSQIGHFVSNNITIDFDTLPSRDGAQSTLGQFQQHNLNDSIEISGLHSKTQEANFSNTSQLSTVEQIQQKPSGNTSFQNFGGMNSLVFGDFKKEHSTGKIQKVQSNAQQFLINQQHISFDLENKISLREKEIDKMINQNEKMYAKQELYLQILDELAIKDQGFSSILGKIKQGFSTLVKESKKEKDMQVKKTDDDKSQLAEYKQKVVNCERVMKEMKKQIVSYKTEIQGIKKMESYLNLENYQKLINEFNTLYDQYKGLKQVNKKLKAELTQSNKRERTFLKLLKKTKEYGEQAQRLEQEYEKIFKEDAKYGLSVENLIVDSQDRREPELMDKGGVKIPKLDLSSIFIQREGGDSSQHDGEEESGDEEESDFEDKDSNGDTLDSKAKQDKFEQQKKDFKMRMLQGK